MNVTDFCLQTEIAKRLHQIIIQIMTYLNQEVCGFCDSQFFNVEEEFKAVKHWEQTEKFAPVNGIGFRWKKI